MKSLKNLHRFLSLVLVLLLVTSCYVPAVSAEPAPFIAGGAAVACPELATIVVEGIAIVISGVAALKIAENLGMTWDKTMKGWDRLMKDTGHELTTLNNMFATAPYWVSANSPRGEAVLQFDYYTATSGSGGKKNDRLYHRAKLTTDKKVLIDTKRISEREAVKELREGRDIFTAKKELAEKLVKKVSRENYNAKPMRFKVNNDYEELKVEKHGPRNGEGYYEHYHPKYQNTRPHCWFRWSR